MTDHQRLPMALFLIGIAAAAFLIAMFAPHAVLTVVAGGVTAISGLAAHRVLSR